jgi:hypothetical protein
MLFAATPALADDAGLITLVEGQAKLLRGVSVFAAAEGVKLAQGDIVETLPKSQAQLELSDGTLINLDASSKLYLATYRTSQGRLVGSSEVVLLQGLLKYSRAQGAPATEFRVTAPELGIAVQQASGIVRVTEAKTEVFLESGAAKAVEPAAKGKSSQPLDIKVDEFVASQQGKPLVRLPRAPKDFVSALPRQFLDALPSRRERLKNRVVEPKKERDVTYDDVAPWLRSTSKIRQGQVFVKRYTPRISDPGFRKELEAHLAEHREWHRVLYPEQYRKKDKDRRPEAVPPR